MTSDSHQSQRVELACIHCGRHLQLDKFVTGCPACGETILEAQYDLGKIDVTAWTLGLKQRRANLWRYREVLPLADPGHIVSLGEGGTPLIKASALAANLGLKHLYIKDERQSPTGSFKDRQAAVAVSALKEMGIDEVVVASTGNVAIAYAAYCARAGIKLWAFFPSLTPSEKMREAALYGAEVIKVTGTYDQTKEIAARFAASKGIFLERGLKSVAAIEAMKTVAYEMAEQLGDELDAGARWRAPDWYIQSISGGMGPIGVGKGFREMADFGLIGALPSLGLVQSSGCAPMVEAFHRGQRIATPVENPQTVIGTLATGNPGRAYELLYDYIRDHGGHFVAASDEEAFTAIRILARHDGISVEPATGVAFAGLFKLVQQGMIKADDVVVVNCTGHTLPVESTILGDQWLKTVELSPRSTAPMLPEEGLLSALRNMDAGVRQIVILEDNPDAARLFQRILESHRSYEVHVAHNGRDGLQLIRDVVPDLVVTDLMMADVDGFEVINQIKADTLLSAIPIVVVTAKDLTARERAQLGDQVELLLQKGSPLDDAFIESLVHRLD